MRRRLARVTRAAPAGFVLGGFALTLLIWLLGAGFAWHSRSTEMVRSGEMARGISETLAFNAAATIRSVNAALGSVVQDFGGDSAQRIADRTGAASLLQTSVAAVTAVRDAAVTDAAGRIRHRTAGAEPLPASVSGWPTYLWHRAVDSDRPRLSLLIHGPDGGTERLVASRRISGTDGRFLGIVMMTLDRRALEVELSAGRLWDGAIAGLYAHDGTLLAGTAAGDMLPPLPEALAGRLSRMLAPEDAAPEDAPPGSGTRGTEGAEGAFAAGNARIVAFSLLADMPLAAALAVPVGEALERWREDTVRYALLLVVLTLVLIVTALALRFTVRDLSENQRMMAENERRFRSIFNNAAAGIALVDGTGRIAEINEGFAAILKRPRAELIGRSLLDLTHDDDLKSSTEKAERVRSGEAVTSQYEKRYLLSDGGTVWVEVTISPQIDVTHRDLAPGQPRGSVVVARDITARRAAREVIQEKTRALERSNVELEEFAYVASHDLQEPLRTVASYLQLLQRRHGDELSGDAREYIGFAVAGAHRMSLLIQDLLQYSRVGRKGKPLRPVDLKEPLRQATLALSNAIGETGASVSVPEETPTILADEAEITRLFQNIIGNAIKYRRPDVAPVVSVTIARGSAVEGGGEAEWVISVADNGIGIEPRFFDRVFKIFQRLHGRDQYDGTGVGLSICKKIAERHGGRIWVESTPDVGSTFHIALPTLERARQTLPAETAVEAA